MSPFWKAEWSPQMSQSKFFSYWFCTRVQTPSKVISCMIFTDFWLKIKLLRGLGTSYRPIWEKFWLRSQCLPFCFPKWAHFKFYHVQLSHNGWICKEGGLKSQKNPIFSIQNLILWKSQLQQSWKVLGANIWRRHFELIVLEDDMVRFSKACPYSAQEGAHKFLITLY